VSVDPMRQHFSPFTYGSNNPVNRVDADGKLDVLVDQYGNDYACIDNSSYLVDGIRRFYDEGNNRIRPWSPINNPKGLEYEFIIPEVKLTMQLFFSLIPNVVPVTKIDFSMIGVDLFKSIMRNVNTNFGLPIWSTTSVESQLKAIDNNQWNAEGLRIEELQGRFLRIGEDYNTPWFKEALQEKKSQIGELR